MRMLVSACAFLVASMFAVACPPPAPPAPVGPDASDGGSAVLGEAAPAPSGSPACTSACAVMGTWCAEGRDTFCPSTMTRVEADHLIVPTVCPPGQAGCVVTCAWCATSTSAADVGSKCASSCTAPTP